MRTTALTSLATALVAAGAVAVAAQGGGRPRAADVATANARTAAAQSVHYAVLVRLTKRRQPLILHIAGGASKESLAVHLRLGDLRLKDGTTLPGTTGSVLLSRPFLYESAPNLPAVLGSRWLRLEVSQASARSQVMSAVRALTPAPLLRIVAEAKLRPAGGAGGFAGTVAYDDPVVRTALHRLGGGLEFRALRVFVRVGADGRIHTVRLTGRTADGHTRLAVHASLFGFDRPVEVVPPRPGTFVDRQLAQLQA